MVCQLAAQQGQAVTCLRIDRELRRGRDYVRVVIVATAEAADVAEALGVTWQAVLTAAGDDPAGWDLGGRRGRGAARVPVRGSGAAQAGGDSLPLRAGHGTGDDGGA